MHVRHLFQVSAKNHEKAADYVNSSLEDQESRNWDYYQIFGVLDVETNKYYPDGSEDPDPEGYTVERLQALLEEETSKERYEALKLRLFEDVNNENWWGVQREAEVLDGIHNTVGDKFDLVNDWVNEVNSWNFSEFGITSLNAINGPIESEKKFIVVVDFHI